MPRVDNVSHGSTRGSRHVTSSRVLQLLVPPGISRALVTNDLSRVSPLSQGYSAPSSNGEPRAFAHAS